MNPKEFGDNGRNTQNSRKHIEMSVHFAGMSKNNWIPNSRPTINCPNRKLVGLNPNRSNRFQF